MLPNRFAKSVQRAFTVPEVLAVVAVIMIVLSILLPAFSRSRTYVHQTMCAANMHNWGVAMRSYANNNRGFFPDNRYVNNTTITQVQMDAAYPPSYRSGYHISWNSSVVQQFWKEYLVENNSAAKTNDHDVLNCPTQVWHQVNDINLAGGLVGYFYMPGRTQDVDTNYSFAGNGWVFKDRFGGPDSKAPIMTDMKQWHPDPAWGWFFGPGYAKPGGPISSHARASTGEPEGGNFLFEDAHVTWFKSDTTDNPSISDPNDIIQLGATIGGWRTYYKIPIN